MDLSKNAINGVGALVVGAILVGGGLLVAKPQYTNATDYRNQLSEVKSGRVVQELKLKNLKEQESQLPALKEELSSLEAQIPPSDDIGGIARVVVERLPSGVQLESFAYQPLLPLTAPLPPTVSLETPVAPFDTTAAPLPPSSSTGSTAPIQKSPAAQLQQIPIIISVTAQDEEALTAYLDALSQGPRLILVNQIQNSAAESGTGVSATIYGYAFANAEPVAAPVAPVEGTETPAE